MSFDTEILPLNGSVSIYEAAQIIPNAVSWLGEVKVTETFKFKSRQLLDYTYKKAELGN